VLFVAAAAGVYLETDWWLPIAALGAAVSLVALVAFWGGIYAASAVFALAFDVIVLVAFIWARWNGTELAGI
jgi:hypothetical protein